MLYSALYEGQSKSSRNNGTALLHCNGRTYGTFTVGLMRAHYPAVVVSTCGMVAFHWMPSLVAKRVPWRQGTARSGECGGWVVCGSVQEPLSLRDRRVRWQGAVWLGAEATALACYMSRRFLCTTCTVTFRPDATNSRYNEPSMSKNSGNLLTAPRNFH
jgi:hypothetical protein